MKTVTIPKEEYELYLSIKQKFSDLFLIQDSNRKIKEDFNPREFYKVASVSKDKVDKYLRSVREEWV